MFSHLLTVMLVLASLAIAAPVVPAGSSLLPRADKFCYGGICFSGPIGGPGTGSGAVDATAAKRDSLKCIDEICNVPGHMSPVHQPHLGIPPTKRDASDCDGESCTKPGPEKLQTGHIEPLKRDDATCSGPDCGTLVFNSIVEEDNTPEHGGEVYIRRFRQPIGSPNVGTASTVIKRGAAPPKILRMPIGAPGNMAVYAARLEHDDLTVRGFRCPTGSPALHPESASSIIKRGTKVKKPFRLPIGAPTVASATASPVIKRDNGQAWDTIGGPNLQSSAPSSAPTHHKGSFAIHMIGAPANSERDAVVPKPSTPMPASAKMEANTPDEIVSPDQEAIGK
ncbi:hypothetical protein LTR50_002145 [Elasticomyces elasticus]|nr:hypothetical protein LTR50_002145 [Elasticomyces elasticus]